ncbi:phage I-like protein [Chitinivorax tropicus]|uniref:Phage I-like protein n=1 Tax=Chitinivorax tropicus TaxID=714531 RepID=A0A840MKS5_9PROT|nr:phage protease [Chitinivorax tropicus]MBB5017166.1 phage I-like protein [Chitinivorax tropicus]
MNTAPPVIAILTAKVALGGNKIQLLPAGEFRTGEGRPYEYPTWRLDDPIAALVIRCRAERANARVIEY